MLELLLWRWEGWEERQRHGRVDNGGVLEEGKAGLTLVAAAQTHAANMPFNPGAKAREEEGVIWWWGVGGGVWAFLSMGGGEVHGGMACVEDGHWSCMSCL